MAGRAGQKPCLAPREITTSVPSLVGANARPARGVKNFCSAPSQPGSCDLPEQDLARQGKTGRENVDRQTVCSWFLGVVSKQAIRFGLAMLVVLLSLSGVLWLFGGPCKLAAMVEAKKPIVFTSGRLGTCFVKKLFLCALKKMDLLPGAFKAVVTSPSV